MKVLVATGSKYGSTRELGAVIAEVLDDHGFEVDVEDACDVRSVTYYDAAVIGSAVYGGLWRRDASELLRDHMIELRHREVYLFSCGMETVVRPGRHLEEAEALASDVGARTHQRFPGAIDMAQLNVGERAIIRALNPPRGDFRDLAAVRRWASHIATQLGVVAAA